MIEETCDAYEPKGNLGSRRRKTYMTSAKENYKEKPDLDKERVRT